MPYFLPRLHTPRVKFHHLTFFISQRSLLLLVYLYQKDEGAHHWNLHKSTFSAFYFYPLRVNVFRLLNHPLLLPLFFSFYFFFLGGGAQLLHRKSFIILPQQLSLPQEPDVVKTEYYRILLQSTFYTHQLNSSCTFTTG